MAMYLPESDYLVPDWPVPPTVRALCSTRRGGLSSGPYAGLNLGLHVGDNAQTVHANRARLQAAMGLPAVFIDQVHGTTMADIAADSRHALQADGAWTRQAGVACTVMVADCLPVLLCEPSGQWVAAAHAGWRGLLGSQGQGILEAAVATFGVSQAHPLMAWLGPCIGPQAFEVGDEVRAAFVETADQAAACFTASVHGKWLADLPGLARQRLRALGITRIYGNDGGQDWCTVSNPLRFFSHRRDGVSGRMAAAIWRVG